MKILEALRAVWWIKHELDFYHDHYYLLLRTKYVLARVMRMFVVLLIKLITAVFPSNDLLEISPIEIGISFELVTGIISKELVGADGLGTTKLLHGRFIRGRVGKRGLPGTVAAAVGIVGTGA